ncbi:MAG: hypothetical protein HOP30_11035 [Cyclobacteriaceae bacterium]|nr:hypothetical protein [Cyclobacteriaceae bacterium]
MRMVMLVGALLVSSCSVDKLYLSKQQRKSSGFEQVGFDDLARLYVDKQTVDEIEGIYSVSGLIIKKSKALFSGEEKEKIIEQRDNYSKVAIFRDHQKSDREYFEVSLDKEGLPSYSIRGEFNKVTEGNILVYKHFEPRKKVLNYTFTYDAEKNMLEGIRTETNGNTVITFKLTYLKLFPKKN